MVYDIDTNPIPARIDGPALSTYPLGQFVDDYEYAFQEGDLTQLFSQLLWTEQTEMLLATCYDTRINGMRTGIICTCRK